MRLSLLIEQFVSQHEVTTITAIARQFGISEQRCQDELAAIAPFGVDVSTAGMVSIHEKD